MQTLTALSVCAALTLSTAAFAQNSPDPSKAKALQQNASPIGADAAKQSGSPNTESGPSKGTSQGGATESKGGTGSQTPKMQGDTGTKVK